MNKATKYRIDEPNRKCGAAGQKIQRSKLSEHEHQEILATKPSKLRRKELKRDHKDHLANKAKKKKAERMYILEGVQGSKCTLSISETGQ